jgi:hypothetical protein
MIAIRMYCRQVRQMRPVILGKTGRFISVVFCTLLPLAPLQVQGAVAQGTGSAEVVNPAELDTASLLVAAVAGATGRGGPSRTEQQVQPEVSLLSAPGVTWLNIDYD